VPCATDLGRCNGTEAPALGIVKRISPIRSFRCDVDGCYIDLGIRTPLYGCRIHSLTKGLVEKALMFVYPMDNTIARPIAVGAYGGTPGRNALRPYGIWAGYLKIRMFFLPRIFESIRNYLHLISFSTSPQGQWHTLPHPRYSAPAADPSGE